MFTYGSYHGMSSVSRERREEMVKRRKKLAKHARRENETNIKVDRVSIPFTSVYSCFSNY